MPRGARNAVGTAVADGCAGAHRGADTTTAGLARRPARRPARSEEHTSELQSRQYLLSFPTGPSSVHHDAARIAIAMRRSARRLIFSLAAAVACAGCLGGPETPLGPQSPTVARAPAVAPTPPPLAWPAGLPADL